MYYVAVNDADAPRNLSGHVLSSNPTRARLSWLPPMQAPGAVTYYSVHYGPVPTQRTFILITVVTTMHAVACIIIINNIIFLWVSFV